jgi:hypothetical protein
MVVAGILKDISTGAYDAGGEAILQGSGSDSFTITEVGGAANQLAGASFVEPGLQEELIIYDTGSLVEVGGNSALGVNWGRWATGTQLNKNGVESGVLVNGVAFVYSPNITTDTQWMTTATNLVSMDMGLQTYNYSNGPSIRDETGAVVTGSGSIMLDFMNGDITAWNFSGSGNGRTYSASLSGGAPVPVSGWQSGTGIDLSLSGNCTGGACGNGLMLYGHTSGLFVGPNAEGIISYFELNDINATIGASGAGLFLR